MDISPGPDGQEENPYFETIIFAAAGEVKNAEEQVLAIVRYHQVVQRKSNAADPGIRFMGSMPAISS